MDGKWGCRVWILFHKDFNIYTEIDSQIALQNIWVNRCSSGVAAIIQARIESLQSERKKFKKEVVSLCYAVILNSKSRLTDITKDREGQKRAGIFFNILDDLDIEDEFWCLEKPYHPKP